MRYFPNFKDFINQRRVFVSLLPSAESQKDVAEMVANSPRLWNGKNHSGNDVSKEDFLYHITLWYSKTGNPPFITSMLKEPIVLETESWDKLGINNEHLTIKFKRNNTLETLKDSMGEEYGLTSDWPTFKPHMTTTYHFGNKRVPPNSLLPKTITFEGYKIEESFGTQ